MTITTHALLVLAPSAVGNLGNANPVIELIEMSNILRDRSKSVATKIVFLIVAEKGLECISTNDCGPEYSLIPVTNSHQLLDSSSIGGQRALKTREGYSFSSLAL